MNKKISRRRFIINGSQTVIFQFIISAFSFSSECNAEPKQHFILKNKIKYNGMYSDVILCLQHLGSGHRSYNNYIMRFHMQDMLSPFELGGDNSYTYVNGDPINRIDPSGNVGKLFHRSNSFSGIGNSQYSANRHTKSLYDFTDLQPPSSKNLAELIEYHPSVTGWNSNMPSRTHSNNEVFKSDEYRFIGYHSTNRESAISIARNGILASAIGSSLTGRHKGVGFYCAPYSGLADCFRRAPHPTMLRIYIRNDRFINASGIDGGFMPYKKGGVSFTRSGSVESQRPSSMETVIREKYYSDIIGSIASDTSSCSTIGPLLARRHSLGG